MNASRSPNRSRPSSSKSEQSVREERIGSADKEASRGSRPGSSKSPTPKSTIGSEIHLPNDNLIGMTIFSDAILNFGSHIGFKKHGF